MGSIGTSVAPIPQVAAGPAPTSTGQAGYGSLSGGSVDRMRQAGIPEDVIGVADSAVSGLQTAQNGGFPPVAPTGTTPLPTGPVAPQAGMPTGPGPMPAATPGAAPDPTLDRPDTQYTGLTKAHVMLLRAVGTPENIIAYMDQQNFNAGYVEQYIQTEILQHPEEWDAVCGNPLGTARAGIQRLIPNIQLPPPGQTGPVTTTPVVPTLPGTGIGPVAPTAPQGNTLNTVTKTLLWVGAGALVAFGAYKLLKGRGAAAAAHSAGMWGGGPAGEAMAAAQVLQAQGNAMMMVHNPAQLDLVRRGLPVAHETFAQLGNASLVYNFPLERILDWHKSVTAQVSTEQIARIAREVVNAAT